MIAHTATTPLQLIGEPSDVTTDTNGRKRRGLSLQMIEHKHNAKKDKHQGSQLGSPRVLVLLSHFEDGSVCRHFLTGMRWKQLVSSICVETQNSTSHEVPNFPPEHSAIDEKHRKVKDASKSYTSRSGILSQPYGPDSRQPADDESLLQKYLAPTDRSRMLSMLRSPRKIGIWTRQTELRSSC